MFYTVKLAIVIAATMVLSLATVLCGLFDPHGKRVYRINQFWTWLIVKFSGITLTVEGLNRLDPQRQYLFVVNHQSNFDIPVLVQALPQFQLRWIAKKELLWIPFFGWAMWAAKHITVDRADALDALKSLKLAKQRIAAGISVVVFPEGTRSTRRQVVAVQTRRLSPGAEKQDADCAGDDQRHGQTAGQRRMARPARDNRRHHRRADCGGRLSPRRAARLERAGARNHRG